MSKQGICRFNFQAALVLVVTLTIIFATPYAAAQTSTAGKVSGTVTDPSGAVVPKAELLLLNLATNAALRVTSDVSGGFDFPVVPPGTYRLTVKMAGFRTESVTDIQVDVEKTLTIPVKLAVGIRRRYQHRSGGSEWRERNFGVDALFGEDAPGGCRQPDPLRYALIGRRETLVQGNKICHALQRTGHQPLIVAKRVRSLGLRDLLKIGVRLAQKRGLPQNKVEVNQGVNHLSRTRLLLGRGWLGLAQEGPRRRDHGKGEHRRLG